MKYINYLWHAKTRYAVHSPFVYTFVNEILRDKKNYSCYEKIEKIRKSLKRSGKSIRVADLGAGSRKMLSTERKVADIARYSLMKPCNAQLLFRIAKKYNFIHILELGTSLGITSAYLASASADAKIYTIEGSEEIQREAKHTAERLDLKNIEFISGNFDDTLPGFLDSISTLDLVLIDGNHRKEPVLHYFDSVLKKSHNDSVLIVDDIHWSEEMESAWEEIKKNEKVSVTIDLFYMGIVFLRKELHKEDFMIR